MVCCCGLCVALFCLCCVIVFCLSLNIYLVRWFCELVVFYDDVGLVGRIGYFILFVVGFLLDWCV